MLYIMGITMKYFKESYRDKIRLEYTIERQDADRILSIKYTDNKQIRIREECDQYFTEEYTPWEAVALLEEAIEWIKKRANI